MRIILANHTDFSNEKTVVEHFLLDRGHFVRFIPKFHSELNPIERVWTIRKYFRKARDYEMAYREGHNAGNEVEQALKVYKSHRRIFF